MHLAQQRTKSKANIQAGLAFDDTYETWGRCDTTCQREKRGKYTTTETRSIQGEPSASRKAVYNPNTQLGFHADSSQSEIMANAAPSVIRSALICQLNLFSHGIAAVCT